MHAWLGHERTRDDPSPWRLRFDIGSTLALVWIADPTGRRPLNPDVHLYLADRYGRLARHHRLRGNTRRAAPLENKAERHFELGGGDAPRPAAAMAMPIPRPLTFVDAVAHREADDSDDAA
jgi:hypothetical protein